MIEIGGQTLLSRLVHALEPHVPAIHVVVGYREEMVIEHCATHHRNVILVRNPEYRVTNASHSFALGSAHLRGHVLFTDGDLLVSPASLAEFVAAAACHDILVGLTAPTSEEGVFAHGVPTPTSKLIEISGFSRTTPSGFEWSNVVVGPARMLDDATGFVFERLAEKLPLRGKMLVMREVDTEGDLAAARIFSDTELATDSS